MYYTRKKCPYSEVFWSTFSRIWTQYGEILRISPYSIQMQENTDQNNSEYGHFSRIITLKIGTFQTISGRNYLKCYKAVSYDPFLMTP